MSEEEMIINFKKEIVYMYTKFVRHYAEKPNYNLIYSSANNTLLDNFLLNLSKDYPLENIGSEFLMEYLYFSFSFWKSIEREDFKDFPLFNWVFGKRGYERWRSKNKEWKYFAEKNLGQKPKDLVFSIKISGKSTSKVDKKNSESGFISNYDRKSYRVVNHFEESDKKKFLNTEEGFLNCLEFTSLYNGKSRNCVRCKFSKECKIVLKKEFPTIAEIRKI